MTHYFAGEFIEAVRELERSLALFEPGRDDDLAVRFPPDPGPPRGSIWRSLRGPSARPIERFLSSSEFRRVGPRGIENDWPYIFTDTEFEPLIEARFAAIKQGFDRIRGREPRR